MGRMFCDFLPNYAQNILDGERITRNHTALATNVAMVGEVIYLGMVRSAVPTFVQSSSTLIHPLMPIIHKFNAIAH